MLFPWAEVAPPAELLAGTFDGSAVSAGFAVVDADEDEAEAGGVVAEPADVPPRLVTYETRAFKSAAFTVRATMPAAFILAVGAFRSAVSLAGGY
jgi:hypothetical protein